MLKLRLDPLNAEEVRAAHAITMALMIQHGILEGTKASTEATPVVDQKPLEDISPEPITNVKPEETSAATAPELDARGMPWDERIHASTKTMLANGNWKNKRGVDPEELSRVENNLLGVEEASADTVDEETQQQQVERESANQDVEVTIDDVREVLAIKANANRDAIRAELDRLGDESVTFMKKEHYAGFKTFLEKLP